MHAYTGIVFWDYKSLTFNHASVAQFNEEYMSKPNPATRCCCNVGLQHFIDEVVSFC